MTGRRRTAPPRRHGASGVTIRDVAARSGASIATVSHVLNNTRPVSPELRARVLEAAARLNFRPSPSARGLRLGHGALLELVMPDTSGSFSRLAKAAAMEAQDRGSRLILTLDAASQSPEAAELIEQSAPHPVDASLYPGKAQAGRHLPGGLLVTCAVMPVPLAPTDRVLIDLGQAAFLAASSLLRARCGKIGLLWSTRSSTIFAGEAFSRAAEIGVVRALRRHGLGRLSLFPVRVDDDHLEAARSAMLEAGAAGMIVNSRRVLDELRHSVPGSPGTAAALCISLDDDTGGSCEGSDATIRWHWEMAGRYLVHAALEQPGAASPPAAITFGIRSPDRVTTTQGLRPTSDL